MEAGKEQIMDAFKPYEQFCKAMLDAYVVVDVKGKILKSNPAAALLTGVSSKHLLKVTSIEEVLTMSVGGQTLSAKDILANIGPTRIDDIIASTGQNAELNLTIGYFPFLVDATVIGAFILIRDVTAETQLQSKYKDKASKSITDPLTGLFNRAHFEDFMRNEEPRIATLPVGSDHRNLTMIMGDIDFFKKINDKFGHPAGDYVIKTVAQIFQKTFRRTDIVCRYGGEEFLVILPASDAIGSAIAAEKARDAIEKFKFEFEGVTIPVTMSLGVAQMIVGQEMGKDTISRADAALYQSKHNGRNQVSLHTGAAIIGYKLNAA
jgi:diguanylate cyclase (GGDEF)-like protein/PAS domain S-box-containing protein